MDDNRKPSGLRRKRKTELLVSPENHSRTWFVENESDVSRREDQPMRVEETGAALGINTRTFARFKQSSSDHQRRSSKLSSGRTKLIFKTSSGRTKLA